MVFSQPLWLAALLVLPAIWLFFRRRGKVGITRVDNLKTGIGSRTLMILPKVLFALGFVALCLALARPQRVYFESDQTEKARDIVIAVDKSGSMGSPITGPLPRSVVGVTDLDRDWPGRRKDKEAPTTFNGQEVHSRLEVAQAAVLDFVRNRYIVNAGDRIGVMVFDMRQYWSWPLTRDLKMVYRKVRFVDEGAGGGTNFGSDPPGPVDKAIEHFDDLGKAKSRVIIMVTDGEDDISREAEDRMASEIEKYNVHFYVIGVGETLVEREVDITRFAARVGGHVFRAGTAEDMQTIFTTIDRMERSDIKTYGSEKRDELFPPFALAALLLLAIAAVFEALILNQ